MDEKGKTEQDRLEGLYGLAMELYQNDDQPPELVEPYHGHCGVIVENQETSRGVLAVLITLLLKKFHCAEQDIRLHQTKMEGGFSGRGLDRRVVTPFMRHQKFPYMKSGSGWLTSSQSNLI